MRWAFKIFYYVFIVLWLAFGIFAVANPGLAYFWVQRLTYLISMGSLGIIVLAVGVIFILGSWVSGWQNLIALFGLLGVVNGLFLIITPKGSMNDLLSLWFSLSPDYYRYFGIAMIVLALLLFKAIRTPHSFLR